jgi:hypothetical protein
MKKVLVIVSALVLSVSFIPFSRIFAASLTTGSVSLSDSRINIASVTYSILFSGVSLSPIKCIKVQFSDAATAGAKPAGMTITSLALSGTSNYVPTPASWTPSNNNTTGVSSITFATGETPASASARTVVLTAITNGSTAGTAYFLQFSTYNNIDCSTSPVDSATIAYIYTNGQTVSATVDPTLSFTVAGVASAQTVNGATTTITTTSTTIPLGTLSVGSNSIGAQDLSVGTNANGGYTVTARYTGQLSNGTYSMTNHTGTNASPTTFSAAGTESFGYTTADTTLGTGTAGRFSGNKWGQFSTSNLEVIYSAAAVSETTRFGYQAGIASITPAGSYTTTVIFTATPIY